MSQNNISPVPPLGGQGVGIIGGGIIGLCCAYYLQKEGHDVTIIDKGNLNDGCSFGNAGMIVPSHIIPLASPGIINKGIKWMLNSQSPFYIRPGINKDLFRWGWLFYRSATVKKMEQAIPVLRDISWLSKQLYIDIANEVNFSFGLSQKGLLMLYRTAAAEKEEKETARIANKADVEAHILSAAEVQKMEPEVKMNVRGGVYFPGDAHLIPSQLMNGLIQYLQQKGVKFILDTKVNDLAIKNHTIKNIITQSGNYSYDEIIISCGSWSPLLLKKMNFSLPLQAGKGYSFDMKEITKKIQIPCLLTEGKVAVTPLENDLRFSGTMEIGCINHSISMKRLRGIVNTIRQFYPEMKVDIPSQKNIWSGLRPCSPDGLPFIGRIKKMKNVTMATGHGMMGMSLGPATGKLVSEIVTGKKASMNMAAFDPERFGD